MPPMRAACSALSALVVTVISGGAAAQLEVLEEGLAIGEWTFYPSVELRLRGEYRHPAADIGGDVYRTTAIQGDDFQRATPAVTSRLPPAEHAWILAERARLGMRVTYDVITAKLTLQDARALALGSSADTRGGFGELAPYEAYLDVRSDLVDPWMWARVGRQPVRWGDGRIIGDNEWSARGRPLDAARMHFTAGDFDLELLAAILALPGSVPPEYSSEPATGGTGAQLYGLDARYQVVPLFGVELAAIARVARDPLPSELNRGDTVTLDVRIAGEERGFEYAAEGAYQLGRVAGYGINRDISAFAVAGRVAWLTALPWDLRFAASGGYASGDSSNGQGEDFSRFDPILPTTHEHHGLMDLYAWSNVFDAGGQVSAAPDDMVRIGVGYTFVGMAQPNDRWSTANLVAVGASPENTSRILGHEIDAMIDLRPWDMLTFSAGYGAFVLGDGGKNVLQSAGRSGDDLLHYGLLQAELKAP